MLTKSKFRPAWWLRNPHLQTLWAARVHPAPRPAITYERVTTPDDDFLDLCWSAGTEQQLVVIFHGLTGSFESRYVRSLMNNLQLRGIGCVLMHFRGCSNEPNRTEGAYHSGHTQDIQYVIELLQRRFPTKHLTAVGYSLGGNALLKYLATADSTPLCHAVSVCPPLVLAEGAARINSGFSRIYQRNLIKQMQNAMRQKNIRYPHLQLQRFDFERRTNFIDWDHHITAPLHGYSSGADYYEKASTLSDLQMISTPTHIIFAKDDPFFTERCIPASNAELSSAVTFEIAAGAGHVGFITGAIPGRGRDWLRERITGLIVDGPKLGH